MTFANVCVWMAFCVFALACFAALKVVQARIDGRSARDVLFSPPLTVLCGLTTMVMLILYLTRKVGLL